MLACLLCGATALAQAPANDQANNPAKTPVAGSEKAVEGRTSKPGTGESAAAIPDISGHWDGGFGKVVVRRAQGESTSFVIDSLGGNSAQGPQEVTWNADTRQYEGIMVDQKSNTAAKFAIRPDADNRRLNFSVQFSDEDRQKVLQHVSEEDLNVLTNQIWKRLPSPRSKPSSQATIDKVLEPTERLEVGLRHSKLVVSRSVVQRVAIADHSIIDVIEFSPREFNVVGTAVGSTTLTVWFDQKAEPLIYHVKVVGERGVPDAETAAMPSLTEQLAAQESAAAAEAREIRQLQASGAAGVNKTAIAERQRKLAGLLGTAFDLKMQQEELQVQELRSRLMQIERQIGQRLQLREKIIARRAGELVDGDAARWDTTSEIESSRKADPGRNRLVVQNTAASGQPKGRAEQTANRPGDAPAANAATPSVAPASAVELPAQVAPLQQRIAASQERVRQLEVAYYKDRSHAAALQRAWDELSASRGELRARLHAVDEIIRQVQQDAIEAQSLAVALEQQRDAKIDQLAKGEATEAEVKAASEARKRAAEAAAALDARLQDYHTTLKALSPHGIEDVAPLPSREPAVPPPGYDPRTALAWLEATTGLRLEFVRLDELALPVTAALRVREATARHQAGDLIISFNGRRFASLEQAVAVQWQVTNGESRNNDAGSVILQGGLAGEARAVRFHNTKWEHDFLRPMASNLVFGAIFRFEVRVHGDKADEIITTYADGVCVSLDGLVAIPVPGNSLVDGERIVVYAPFEGTARVVASDDKTGLTLLKVESPDRKLFPWVKCSSAQPTAGQRLDVSDADSQSTTIVTIAAVGQRYPAPRVGSDGFVSSSMLGAPLGTPLMSVKHELQGVLLGSTPTAPGSICMAAVHIGKLLDVYQRKTAASLDLNQD